MRSDKAKKLRRLRRKRGIRAKLHGTTDRPRLSVFRSNKHIYVQIIDDDRGVTLCAASTVGRDLRDRIKHGGNVAAAEAVGSAIAEKARGVNVEQVRFDRGGYRYGGRIKRLADAAREAGLKF